MVGNTTYIIYLIIYYNIISLKTSNKQLITEQYTKQEMTIIRCQIQMEYKE